MRVRRTRRQRGNPSSQTAPTMMVSVLAILAAIVGCFLWRFRGDAPVTPVEKSVPSAPTSTPPVVEPQQQPWVDLAAGDGPLPSPPADRTANMVLVPAGKFLYGDDNEEIELPAYYIDRYEVSQAEYAQFLRYVRASGDHTHCNPDEPPDKDHTPLNWGRPDLTDPRFPVVGLDYWDVYAYAGWIGKRLPTEQEWEKAARGSDGRLYPWGEDWDDRLCNWGPSPGNPRTLLPVDSMPEGQSPFGCFHMLGNAAEWTGSFVDEARRLHCGRGYCWRIGHRVPYRTTYRMPGGTELRDEGSGLRCALDAE
ncbi:MAG TPA: SUMF1/EgtB/PvdO family nonheme iron enzyme [Pirellulales bacterium]|nr:SUMF1/EgtB/PvdO family nonheme iron enzyme [Pirellulales bacterium]